MLKKTNLLIFAVLFLIGLTGCAGAAPASDNEPAAQGGNETMSDSNIMIMEPFARASIPNGAVYMQLMNSGGSDDALLGAQTDVSEVVEIHETRIDENDMMQMQPVERIEIPASGSAVLEPGGFHVMLLGIDEEVTVGDKFDLTLNFEKSMPQTIEVEVTEGMGMDHENMEHDMEDMDGMEHDMEDMEDMEGMEHNGN